MTEYKHSIEKCEAALNVVNAIEALTGEDRIYISSLVQDVKVYQEVIGKLQEEYKLQEICTECEGGCCVVTVEDRIDEIDYFIMLFDATNEHREMIVRMLNEYNFLECHFKNAQGCILPENTRPVVCKPFFCGENEDLNKILENVYKPELVKKSINLQKVLREMGFELCRKHISRYNNAS